MASLYRKYLRLLEKWPVDPSKGNRDLGSHLREQIKLAFSSADAVQLQDEERCKKTYEVLNRLAENQYKNRYKRTFECSSTGLTAEQCRGVLSDDFLALLQEENRSFLDRMFRNKKS